MKPAYSRSLRNLHRPLRLLVGSASRGKEGSIICGAGRLQAGRAQRSKRRWGGLSERLMVATASSYVISPTALGPIAVDRDAPTTACRPVVASYRPGRSLTTPNPERNSHANQERRNRKALGRNGVHHAWDTRAGVAGNCDGFRQHCLVHKNHDRRACRRQASFRLRSQWSLHRRSDDLGAAVPFRLCRTRVERRRAACRNGDHRDQPVG